MIRTQPIRPLQHPGTPILRRRVSVPTRSTPRWVRLPAGARLVDALADELEATGTHSGQVELLEGSLSRIHYCFPALCHEGTTAVTYSQPHQATTPARVLTGSATLGSRGGERFTHCHAAWLDAAGTVRGGHLLPDTIIGPVPVHAVIHAFDQVELLSDIDPETRMPVFTPHARPPQETRNEGAVRAVMSRLAPGEPIQTAVTDIMREHGFSRASVSGSLGSFVGAVLDRADSTLVVNGPATEVTIGGQFATDSIVIHGMAVDRFGTVHMGSFIGRDNIVAITMELLVEEVTT